MRFIILASILALIGVAQLFALNALCNVWEAMLRKLRPAKPIAAPQYVNWPDHLLGPEQKYVDMAAGHVLDSTSEVK